MQEDFGKYYLRKVEEEVAPTTPSYGLVSQLSGTSEAVLGDIEERMPIEENPLSVAEDYIMNVAIRSNRFPPLSRVVEPASSYLQSRFGLNREVARHWVESAYLHITRAMGPTLSRS